MIVIFGVLVGAWLGVRQARRLNGQRLDMLQYGAVYAIIGALVGLALTVAIEWSF